MKETEWQIFKSEKRVKIITIINKYKEKLIREKKKIKEINKCNLNNNKYYKK